MLIKKDEAIDTFLNGRLKIIQSSHGYRFSVDALLLAEFVSVKNDDYVVDLGAGCGIISLLIAINREVKFIFGVEIQEGLASQARRNVVLNHLEEKISITRGDLRNLPINPGSANVVICNPPYRKGKSGRVNPDPCKAIARHEIAANLNDILNAGKTLLELGGKLALIYPANRLTEIFIKMRTHGLEPKRLQIIYPDAASNAKLAMIEGRHTGNPGVKILPPIFGQGNFSIEAQ
ncbi:MAG: methyltransferase [Thermodesulfobacteriota bacterium]|nr:methyltransferase [Thermodesulfobacteriota bacterium]